MNLKNKLIEFFDAFTRYNENNIIEKIREEKKAFEKQVNTFLDTHGEATMQQSLKKTIEIQPKTTGKINSLIEKWKKRNK